MNKENTQKLYRTFPNLFLVKLGEEELKNRLDSEWSDALSKIPDQEGRYPVWPYGIEVNNGWFDLIFSLCENISHLARIHDLSPHVSQVKEKFGGLRFHVWLRDDIKVVDEGDGCGRGAVIERKPGVDEIYRLIEEAQQKSESICETCGSPGTMRRDGWHHVACDPCETAWRSR